MRKFTNRLIVIVLVVSIISIVRHSYARVEPEMPERYTLHMVQEGDTFWGISREYMPKVDPRIGVHWIKLANGLEDEPGYIMQPGDRLNVPDTKGKMAEPWGQD